MEKEKAIEWKTILYEIWVVILMYGLQL